MYTHGFANASPAAKQPVSIGNYMTVTSTLCLIARNTKQRVSLGAMTGQNHNVRRLCCLFCSGVRRKLEDLLQHSEMLNTSDHAISSLRDNKQSNTKPADLFPNGPQASTWEQLGPKTVARKITQTCVEHGSNVFFFFIFSEVSVLRWREFDSSLSLLPAAPLSASLSAFWSEPFKPSSPPPTSCPGTSQFMMKVDREGSFFQSWSHETS